MSDAFDLDAGPDPATVAAAKPEPTAANGSVSGAAAGDDHAGAERDGRGKAELAPVRAVGIGPGNLDYLTPRARAAVEEADVVVGFETVVEYVRDVVEGDTLTCGYRDEAATLERFADRVSTGAIGTAVLMGDPNHSGYQFVGKVQAAVDRRVRVVPGISSLQVAASRARTPMEATTFVTLHKSGDVEPDLRRLRTTVGDRHLLVLPRPYDWMPGDVAAHLVESGAAPSLSALVFEHLTHEVETTTRSTLGALATHAGGSDPAASPFSDLSVLAVRRD